MQTLEAQTALPARRRFTLEEFFRMGEFGFFDDQRVELVDGEVYVLPPQGYRHSSWIHRLSHHIEDRLGELVVVFQQSPVILDSLGEAYIEPDVGVVRPPQSQYAGRFVVPADLFLAVEVSDTTLKRDRGPKQRLYARNGVPELWIIDVNANRLEVYRDPRRLRDERGATAWAYADVLEFEAGSSVAPLVFPESPLEWWEPQSDA